MEPDKLDMLAKPLISGVPAGAGPLGTPVDTIEAFTVAVPLPEPLVVLGARISQREFVFVRVHAGGCTGTGFGLARGAAVDIAVRQQIASHVVGKPVGSIRAVWNAARDSARMTGEGGTFARALSVVDIALWDLMGDLLKVPLWKLLGGDCGEVPCAAIAGYYRDDPVESIRQDAERLATAGYRIFKVPFGMDPEIDLKRIGAMRDVIGDEPVIALDAGGVFNSHKAALQACLPLEKFNIAYFEDLFPAQAWEVAVSFAQRYDLKVAFGESVSSPRIIQVLGSANGVDIVRPDATHQLGITGYFQGIAPALENGVEIFPHYFPDIHAPLVGALGGKMVEESPMEADTVGLRLLRSTQPKIRNGTWYLNDRPGLGIDWDEDALKSLKVVTP